MVDQVLVRLVQAVQLQSQWELVDGVVVLELQVMLTLKTLVKLLLKDKIHLVSLPKVLAVAVVMAALVMYRQPFKSELLKRVAVVMRSLADR